MILLRFLLALLVLVAAPAAAQPQFPALGGRVVDSAGVLTPEVTAQLGQLSQQVEQASGRQLVVASVADLQGYPIEEYGYQLGRFWKIGQEGANNGIILLVAPNDRKVRIEVGYGLEPIMTDALSAQIIAGQILPRFKDGDLPGGVLAGAQAIAEQLKLPLEAGEKRAQALTAARGERRGSGGEESALVAAFWVMVIVLVLLTVFRGGGGGGGGRRGGRRYRRGIGPVVLWGPGFGGGSSWGSGGGSSWGGGGGGFGGGFSGGGGSFGGGGASGSW